MESIINDIKGVFRSGNMVNRLIVLNVIVFVLVYLIKIIILFTGPNHQATFQSFVESMSIHSDMMYNLKHPWVFITHAIFHVGVFHMAMNMLMLYWFGRIVGDLIGDHRVLPIFIFGCMAGLVFYLVFTNVAPEFSGYAHGASAGVMAMVVAAGMIAPEYLIRLILIGTVRLKYVVLVVLLFDLIGLSNLQNTGGRIAHFGGSFMGFLFIYLLNQGQDLSTLFERRAPKTKRSGSAKVIKMTPRKKENETNQNIDTILEKIKRKGINSLSNEERRILDEASKN